MSGTTKVLFRWFGDEAEKVVLDQLERAYHDAARKMTAEVRANAPKGETGALASSITWAADRKKTRVRAYVGAVQGSPAIPYIFRQEFGFNWVSKKLREDTLERIPQQEPKYFLSSVIRANRGDIMKMLREAGERMKRVRFTKGVTSIIG